MNHTTDRKPGQHAALVAGRTFDILWYIMAALLVVIALGTFTTASASNTKQPSISTTTAPSFGPLTAVTGSGGSGGSLSSEGGALTQATTGTGGSSPTGRK